MRSWATFLFGLYGLATSASAVNLSVNRETFAPSESIAVAVRSVGDISETAWIGMIPADIPHGDGRVNDQHDRQYRYLKDRVEGILTFNPLPEGKWTARLNKDADEFASVAFEVSKRCVPPGQQPPSMAMDRTRFAPSERPIVRFTAPTAYPAKAWVGIIPAEIPHGDESVNDSKDVQYRYLQGAGEGELEFNPLKPGKWSARMNVWEIETASVDFEVANDVVPPGQNEPGLSMNRERLAPGERPAIRFTAPTAYPANAWVGIIPAETPHGDAGANDAKDVQYRYLQGAGKGELEFNPLKPGKWSARMNVWEIETASVDFEVANDVVPPGQTPPVLEMSSGTIASGKPFSLRFAVPNAYPAKAWVGIIPAEIPHGDSSVNDSKDVQYRYIGNLREGELSFNGLPAGKWSARVNVWGVESISIEFEVTDGPLPPARPVVARSTVKPEATAEENARANTIGVPDETAAVARRPESAREPGPSGADQTVETVTDAVANAPPTREVSGQPVATVSSGDGVPATDSKPAGSDPASDRSEKDSSEPVEPEPDGPPTWLADMPDLPEVAPLQLSPDLDLTALTGDAYAGLVSQAKAGLAEILGPMSARQQAAYDASWQPMFRYPAPECIDYLEQVLPVIGDVLRLRPALAEQIADVQMMWESAGYAELYEPEAARLVMEQAQPGIARLKAMEAAFSGLVERLDSLGDPPQPEVLQEQAARRHQRAMRNLEALLLGQAKLDGYFERQQMIELAPQPSGARPFFSVIQATRGLATRAITPLGGSQSDLVLFSEYIESEEESEGLLGLEFDFDFDPWSAWYAEPTEDGWAEYAYDPEDGWLDVTFYRPETDRLIIDTYSVVNGEVEGNREILHRAPLEAAPHVYGDEIDPSDPQAFVRAHKTEAAEAEADFRRAKAAYQAFIEKGGVLPPFPEPEDVYWVLKDIKVKEERRAQNRAWAYASPGIPATFVEQERFEHGPNHLSAAWQSVDLDWEYPEYEEGSGGAANVRIIDPASEFVADPDSEGDPGPGSPKPVEKSQSRGATVQWGMPPAVLKDGACWAIDPRLEGDSVAFGIDKLIFAGLDGFTLVDTPDIGMGFPGGRPRGVLLNAFPVHADEDPGVELEKEAALTVFSENETARGLVASLRSRQEVR